LIPARCGGLKLFLDCAHFTLLFLYTHVLYFVYDFALCMHIFRVLF
jgi:hypothetical protein